MTAERLGAAGATDDPPLWSTVGLLFMSAGVTLAVMVVVVRAQLLALDPTTRDLGGPAMPPEVAVTILILAGAVIFTVSRTTRP